MKNEFTIEIKENVLQLIEDESKEDLSEIGSMTNLI